MPRFCKEDIVVVRDVIFSSRKGETARVIEIKPGKHGRASTLDKYVVQFTDGMEKELWDIQLQILDSIR